MIDKKELEDAKNFMAEQGCGTGTNYTTALVTSLLCKFAELKQKEILKIVHELMERPLLDQNHDKERS